MQFGYGSKRFAKGGAAAGKTRPVSTVSGNAESTSDAFTPEERAKILAMLAGTRLSNPRAYSNAAYDPNGSAEFAADANGHLYDAIPGDQYDDVPLDSPV